VNFADTASTQSPIWLYEVCDVLFGDLQNQSLSGTDEIAEAGCQGDTLYTCLENLVEAHSSHAICFQEELFQETPS
jgi:hypothetical protein